MKPWCERSGIGIAESALATVWLRSSLCLQMAPCVDLSQQRSCQTPGVESMKAVAGWMGAPSHGLTDTARGRLRLPLLWPEPSKPTTPDRNHATTLVVGEATVDGGVNHSSPPLLPQKEPRGHSGEATLRGTSVMSGRTAGEPTVVCGHHAHDFGKNSATASVPGTVPGTGVNMNAGNDWADRARTHSCDCEVAPEQTSSVVTGRDSAF